MKYRILLVEDDETMVDILKRNLEKWDILSMWLRISRT